jgi:hypothetical protein
VLNYNTTQELFFGGNFWDGRATGYKLQTADAEGQQPRREDPRRRVVTARVQDEPERDPGSEGVSR